MTTPDRVDGNSRRFTESELKTSGGCKRLLGQLVSAILRAEPETLSHLKDIAFWGRCTVAREGELSLQPLEDPKVRYGYYLALHDLADVARHSVIPYQEIGAVIGDELAYKTLSKLAEKPIGLLRKSEIVGYLTRSNLVNRDGDLVNETDVISMFDHLEEEGLISQDRRGGEENFTEVVALTAKGNQMNEVLKLLNTPAQPGDTK